MLSVLDLCTGTGCIPLLLLHSLLHSLPSPIPIHIHGVDVSPHAVNLARQNHAHNVSLNHLPRASSSSPYTLTFSQLDIFSPSLIPHLESHLLAQFPKDQQPAQNQPKLDLLISNPPYISRKEFARSTARAVRNYEPRLALVPPHFPLLAPSPFPSPSPSTTTTPTTSNPDLSNTPQQRYNCRPEDVFYARLLEIAHTLQPKRVLMEVGGWEQAVRVVGLVAAQDPGAYETVEIWRDEPAYSSSSSSLSSSSSAATGAHNRGTEEVDVAGRVVRVRGEGKGRAVYLVRADTTNA